MELPVPGERSLLAPAFRLIDRDLPASAEPHYQGLALHFQHSLAATATQRQPTPLPLGIPNFQGSFGVPHLHHVQIWDGAKQCAPVIRSRLSGASPPFFGVSFGQSPPSFGSFFRYLSTGHPPYRVPGHYCNLPNSWNDPVGGLAADHMQLGGFPPITSLIYPPTSILSKFGVHLVHDKLISEKTVFFRKMENFSGGHGFFRARTPKRT